MRVGIDASCWANRRGFGRFTRNLVGEMARLRSGRELIVDAPSRDELDLPAGVEVVAVAVDTAPAEAASAAGRRSTADLMRMARAAHRARCDAFYFPATYSYFPMVGTPRVVTVHDAIAEKAPELVLPSRRAQLFWKLKQAAAVRGAAGVVTVSQASRVDILRWLNIPEERLHVIREAPDPMFRPIPADQCGPLLATFGLGPADRFLLYVGGISPHKNLEVLVRAFENIVVRYPDLRLLIVGDTDDDPFLSSSSTLRGTLAASPVGTRTTLTGYVDDEVLVALYNAAVATVLPSLGEGYGLTAAESAACGTPVVASKLPALVELLGDAALYAQPRAASDFANAFRLLLDDPDGRSRLGEASLERAAGWSWTAAAETVLALLDQAAATRRA